MSTTSSPLNGALDFDFDRSHLPGSSYGYSGTALSQLADGATEYTLATIVVDGSGSTGGFRREMQDAVGQIVVGCQRNPRADNMMLRLVEFDDDVREEHGFKMLTRCNPGDYADFMRLGGTTALYDSADNAVGAMVAYGQQLTDQQYAVNGIAVVITDGGDNASKLSATAVKKRVEDALRGEVLESLVLILVGLNPAKDAALTKALSDFAQDAGFRYIDITDLTPAKFAKLADFISRSVSAQSQSLGTGGPSKPIDASQLVI
ncbi:MAG TPA: VWA domain-containing protein [Armatimonadaceae bacterium]|jgi:uncharacterized protein YegL|nr:VWA domain-containing protein [Armatimonadaceae bacterium]